MFLSKHVGHIPQSVLCSYFSIDDLEKVCRGYTTLDKSCLVRHSFSLSDAILL